MSISVMAKVFWTKFESISYLDKNKKEIRISPQTAKIIMLVIGDTANDYGENSWQSINTIAYKSSVKRRTVIRTIKSLLAGEYLFLNGKGKKNTNNFSINIDKLSTPPSRNTGIMTKDIERVVTLRHAGSVLESPDSLGDSSLNNIPSKKIEIDNLQKGAKMDCAACEYLAECLVKAKEVGFENADSFCKKPIPSPEQEIPKSKEKAREDKLWENVILNKNNTSQYADRLSDYPERCRKNLQYFLEIWCFSPKALPKKSKSKGGLYATWIKGIDELVEVSGEDRFKLVLDRVHSVWYDREGKYKTTVDMPISLLKMFKSIDAELRQEEKAKLAAKSEEVVIVKEEYVDQTSTALELKKWAKSLRKQE